MSGDYQDFGYEGKPETCLWCGRKLQRKTLMDRHATDLAHRDGTLRPGLWISKPAEKLGSYQDDCFCGLRCGYQFGLRLAEFGRRLQGG